MLPLPFTPLQKARSSEPAAIEETKDAIVASGDGFRYTFCMHRGTFVSLVIDGVEQLESPMALTLFRAPIDNERKIKHLWTNQTVWEGENLNVAFHKTYEVKLQDNVIRASCSVVSLFCDSVSRRAASA